MRLFNSLIFFIIFSGAAMASENAQPLSQYESLAKISAI